MTAILAISAAEFRIAFRNRWVAIAIAMMAVFSLVLAGAGSAPTGTLGADRLSVTVASLTSLAVYLVPLVALLMSFDAIAGEVECGTLPLMLTYPLGRFEILLGKFIAHLIILSLAVAIGYGLAAGAAIWADPRASAGFPAMFRLYNLAASEATAAAAGIGAAAQTIPPAHALASILLWPLLGLGLAVLAFRKVTP